MAVNISTDTNTVKVTATTTNTVKIVDNGNNTSVSVSQPTTRVIKVATVGPQGPAGLNGTAFPYSGSAVITGSLSQGLNTIASGGYSHAEGTSTISRGYGSHAEGFNTTSTGSWSHTEGVSTMAFGEGSHAEGLVTVALGDYQHVQGAYNITSSAKTAFIIGNGTSNSTRSNLVFASGSQFQITGSLVVSGSNTFVGNQTISGSIYLRSGSVINSTGADIGIRAGVGNNAGVALYNNSFTQYLAVDDTGSYANKFTVADRLTVVGSNGRLVYTGTTPVYPYTLAEIHANDDYPWLHRFHNDTFSTSSAVMAYYGHNDGRFVFHNESTQSIGLQVNGYSAENGLLVYSDKVAFVNNVVVTGSLTVSGSITGAANLATTGSVTFTGNQIVTGSTRGNVVALSIASNTASMDLSVGNFFTLQLVSGSNTHINPSNILPGQTSILTLSTTGSATVSFPSIVKQPSGSAYIPTTTAGIDILTFASTDSSTLYVVGTKNMI